MKLTFIKKTSLYSGFIATLILAACSPFKTPVPPSQVAVPSQFAQAAAGQASDISKWWLAWNDPALTKIIEDTLKANLDLRIARDHIQEAKSNFKMTKSSLSPTIGVTGNIAGGGTDSRNRYLNSFSNDSSDPTSVGHIAGVTASWDADLFGARHADAKAAKAEVLGQEAQLHQIQMAIAAEVASYYTGIQCLRKRLALIDQRLILLENLKSYTQARFNAGQATLSDIKGLDVQINILHSYRPDLESAIAASLRHIAILGGKTPENVEIAISSESVTPPAPAGELPSTVLNRRPDIAAAEANINAALNRLKSAKADLLPRFGLQFFGGDGRIRFSGLSGFSNSGGIMALTAYLPIFTAGRVHAHIALEDAKLDEAVAFYDKKLLSALTEVENAYQARSSQDKRITQLSQALATTEQNITVEQGLYQGGKHTLQNVLETKLDKVDKDDSLIQTIQQQQMATINLYYALGGGWS
ncbi:NodT family RND efflux system outer membrane lipoprotein [Zymomonas mobilis subsp. mobilis ZM4 = ATCC 31821]|uniref:RND efflux system, outer membrane lipoprotein, NodT family n=1 Tax=Zymomonas mobilis subsp. mobilis (strain ATCC 31821 / ZM4 / CP4) TaxID=264203 RepID=Q5NPD8_ZYMMO|nr:TolC family protein [Zymomonas mobilis]AAV89422.1 RND efflux system, outer membrane lipoprotein, NodT family [Zymomonas mobilis subsp. mobilis ZM4 = ATCC 31821]AHB09822.1 efflux transporter, outer membrane factor lipoprotein, NodT family [Zymomonas mobilis subsp. mobilis str. CP4 = NRRL B-14023]AHJ70127.1 copper/silver efflux system outer membrane protein CusC [Zymomonas mobilis subsp. mobilis NRRL B-12526]AHJ71982.1 copper/silver efflux system outer membrane protein CusC [Zymomonas mobilis 